MQNLQTSCRLIAVGLGVLGVFNSQVVRSETITSQIVPTKIIISQNEAPPSVPSIPNSASPAPSYLEPSANPLLFPTKPEEVKIQGTQPITLQQSLDLARRNNRPLQIAVLRLESSLAALREAQAAEYPSADLTTNLTYQDSVQSRRAEITRQANTPSFLRTPNSTANTSLSGTVEVSYNVFTSGNRPATIQAAARQVRLNELDVERLQAQTRLDISNAYYDLQQADEQVRIAQAAVTNAQASLRDAQALEKAGVGTRFDVLRAQVQLANSNQDLTRALSQQRVARRQLAQLLSLNQVVDISAAEPVEIAGLWNLPLEDSIVLAFKQRAELEQQLVQREINEQQRLVALSALGPQVSVFANYSFLNQFDDKVGINDGYAIGGRLRWNLFDGGAASARAKQQDLNKEIAETQFSQTRNQIRFEVERAYSNLRANYDNIQTASVALDQARESLRLARLRFQAGVGTQTDVISAETDLTRAEVNRLTAILDYNRALASLQRAISNLPVNTPS